MLERRTPRNRNRGEGRLKKIKIDLSDEELLAFIGNQESQEIYPFQSMGDRLIASLDRGSLVGDKLPWSKTHGTVALGPGELSLWAGINGHGKSQILNQVMTWLACTSTVFIASMEMPAGETLKTMVTQAAGCKPSRSFALDWLRSTPGYIYDCIDKVPLERIMGLAYYAGAELGTDHFVIDSLTMCGVGRDDYEAQAEFVNHLRCAAKRHQMHIHLVCHMRKGENESSKVGKFDIRGAGEIADMADKVFIVQRNKDREVAKRRQEDKHPLSEKQADLLANGFDTVLRLEKNRQDGTERNWGFYFHKDSLQFVTQEGKAMPLTGQV